MWFIITTHSKPDFYTDKGTVVNFDQVQIEWTNEVILESSGIITRIASSEQVLKDPMQAISALYQAGVTGYPTKAEAKKKTKSLAQGGWKYLKVK
jgi:hypothetical protein